MVDNSSMNIKEKLRFHGYSALMSQLSRALGWSYENFKNSYDIFVYESLQGKERKLAELFVCKESFEDELRVELISAFKEIAQRDSELAMQEFL